MSRRKLDPENQVTGEKDYIVISIKLFWTLILHYFSYMNVGLHRLTFYMQFF